MFLVSPSYEFSNLICSHEKPFDLRVGPDEFLVKTKPGMINDAMVKTVVNGVLHGTDAGTVVGEGVCRIR